MTFLLPSHVLFDQLPLCRIRLLECEIRGLLLLLGRILLQRLVVNRLIILSVSAVVELVVDRVLEVEVLDLDLCLKRLQRILLHHFGRGLQLIFARDRFIRSLLLLILLVIFIPDHFGLFFIYDLLQYGVYGLSHLILLVLWHLRRRYVD